MRKIIVILAIAILSGCSIQELETHTFYSPVVTEWEPLPETKPTPNLILFPIKPLR